MKNQFSFKTGLLILLSTFHSICLCNSSDDSLTPIVETKHGSLEGLIFKSREGSPYYAFRGIPYGHYPGRFEVARIPETWNGVRSAKEHGSKCAQMDLFQMDLFLGEEDCLFLNIYTPSIDKKANLPVLFWIHGGGFTSWTGDDFDGKYLVDENVILVSINYRLGPLGFLTFNDGEISGNIGLKDQTLALKWVRENIQSFGGDPSKVTVAGYSAGGASAHYHMLSPLSRGLFRAAISHSGTAVTFWAKQRSPVENAIKLASIVGCPLPDLSTKATVNCLKTKPVHEIVKAQAKMKEWLGYPIVQFAPVVEPEGPDAFISEEPETILQKGNFNKVNWITGLTEDEGILLDLAIILDQNATEVLDDQWHKKAPIMLGYQHLPQAEQEDISKNIRESYFKNFDIGELTWQSLTDLITDRYFLQPLATAILLQSQHSRIFPYVFRFTGDHSFVHKVYGVEGDHGVSHGDDLQYLFPGGSVGGPDYSGETPVEIVDFSKKFVKLWASFIHDMRPSSTWPKETTWKPVRNAKNNSPGSFFEIAIKTTYWEEDLVSRLECLRENLPVKIGTQRSVKSEL